MRQSHHCKSTLSNAYAALQRTLAPCNPYHARLMHLPLRMSAHVGTGSAQPYMHVQGCTGIRAIQLHAESTLAQACTIKASAQGCTGLLTSWIRTAIFLLLWHVTAILSGRYTGSNAGVDQ